MALAVKYASSLGAGGKTGADEANAWDWATLLTTAAAGDLVHFKGDLVLAGAPTFTNDGTAAAPIIIQSYKTTIGDYYQGHDSKGFLTTTNMGAITGNFTINLGAKSYIHLIGFQKTASINGACLTTSNKGYLLRCKVTNTNTGTSTVAVANGANNAIVDNDIVCTQGGSGSSALNMANNILWALYNRITNGGGTAAHGINGPASKLTVIGNVIYRCSGTGLILGALGATESVIVQNSFNRCGTGISFVSNAGATLSPAIINNIFSRSVTTALNNLYSGTADLPALFHTNAFYSNASNYNSSWVTIPSYNDVTESSDPFTDESTDNYTLVTGASSKGAGIVPYLDIGALQRAEAAAGGILRTGRSGGFDI